MTMRPAEVRTTPNLLACVAFFAMLMMFFITTAPFPDLTGAAAFDPAADKSSLVNQIAILLITAGIMAVGLRHPLRDVVLLQPRMLVAALFVWMVATSMIDGDVMALRKLVLTLIMCMNASLFLLLPRSDKQFAFLLVVATLVMLVVAFLGVTLIPHRAIHQFAEIREPMNAGLWRGQFAHKNSAAEMMVFAAFLGLFGYSMGYRVGGIAILILSVIFLLHTGGKSSSAYLPASILLAWLFEKIRWSRIPIIVIGPLILNALEMGCAMSPAASDFIKSIGVDPTFTNRTDIWRFAIETIFRRPITGYGFQGFWQTDSLMYSGGTMETWAVQAYNAHNAFLDVMISSGMPILPLVLLWIVALPLRDANRAERSGNNPALTRLFVRIWIYAIYSAGLESVLFASGDFMWFALVFSMAGLRLQGRAAVISAAAGVAATPPRLALQPG